MGIFATHTVTIKHSDGTVVNQQPLPVTMEPQQLGNWQMQAQSTIPTYLYDVQTVGWSTPVPLYSDYLIDQNGVKYSMYSQVGQYQNSLQFSVSKVSGVTP